MVDAPGNYALKLSRRSAPINLADPSLPEGTWISK